jgi:hypothetical protein
MHMTFFEKIAEQKIRIAMERGEFDNLPLKGKPLPPDDLANVPEELRMSYKILKNANIIPEEIQLRKDLLTLRNLLQACDNESEIEDLTKKINEKQLRYNLLTEQRPGSMSLNMQYHAKIMEKLK